MNTLAFFCMDEKHSCKVGDPFYPAAAVEKGERSLLVQTSRSK